MKREVRRGTYALLLRFDSRRTIRVGALGELDFEPGLYCYIGSAMGGLDSRLERHLSSEKRMRWHIDYLTVCADGMEAWESHPDPVAECDLASEAARCGMIPVHKGFGCYDCRCATHLFLSSGRSLGLFLAACALEPFRPGPQTSSTIQSIIK